MVVRVARERANVAALYIFCLCKTWLYDVEILLSYYTLLLNYIVYAIQYNIVTLTSPWH